MDITRDDVEFRTVDPLPRGRSRDHRRARSERTPASQAGRVTQLHVALSEWTKLRSVRSTRWSLLVAVVGTIGLAALACAVVAHHYPQMSPSDRADFNPLDVTFVGVQLAQLAIGVLGVLVITRRVLDRDDPLLDVRRPQAAARPLGEGGRLRRS